MKNLFNFSLLTLFAVVILTTSCKKEVDGPEGVFPRTENEKCGRPKDKLVNRWKIIALNVDGVPYEVSPPDTTTIFEFARDGKVIVTNPFFPISGDGTWYYNGDKKHFVAIITVNVLTPDGPISSTERRDYTIIELTPNKMWARYTDPERGVVDQFCVAVH